MDEQTIKDLEIFKEGTKNSIFRLIDLTITERGSAELKQRLLHPFSDINKIQQTQQDIRFLLTDLKVWDTILTRPALSYIDKYLYSNINPLKYRNDLYASFSGYWYLHRYVSDYHFLEAGIRCLIIFIQKLNRIQTHTVRDGRPEILQKIFKLLNHLFEIDHKNILKKELGGRPLSAKQLYYLDDLFRNKENSRLQELLELIYKVDALLAMAKAILKYNLSLPDFETNRSTVQIEGVYHLFLPQSRRNNFEVANNKHFIFLTGSNMSGKSTYLKAVGIALVLAHAGMGIPAKSAKMPVFDHFFTDINLTDDIEKGYSYFYREINRLQELSEHLVKGEKVFVLIDEMFRGTNIRDALDCSKAIIQKLLLWDNSIFILSTHFTDVPDFFLQDPCIQYHYLESLVQEGKPHFTHQLKKGISRERLGKLILEESRLEEMLSPPSR